MSASPRYVSLAERYENGIRGGLIASGERLPSVRELSRREGVSVTTALAAMRLLEQRGLAVARPQSGYYANAPARVPAPACSRPPATPEAVAVTDLAMEMHAPAAPGTIALSAALPQAELLPLRPLARALSRAANANPAALLGALEPGGLPALREAIAARMIHAGCSVHPHEIVITAGAAEAVGLALGACTRPGDVVAFESPTYYGLLMMAESRGLQAVEIDTDPRTGLSVEAFEAACRQSPPRALVVSSNVQNPTGACMPEAAKKGLLEVAARYRVSVIEDDVFGEYARQSGQGCSSLKALDEDGIVAYCSSFSKTVAPGLRLGWLIPGRCFRAAQAAKLALSWGCAPVLQEALARLLREGSFENHLRRLTRTLDHSRGQALAAVADAFPADTRACTPRYGFLIWLQLPGRLDSLDFYRRARARGVTVSPGQIFSAGGRFRDCIRLNVGYAWSDTLDDAIRRLGALAGEMLVEAGPNRD